MAGETVKIGDIELCGEEDHLSGLEPGFARVVQEVHYARASTMREIDRGGASRTRTFNVHREHDSPQEARAWLEDHLEACATAAAATFTHTTFDGSVITLTDAVVKTARGNTRGCSTYLSYTIIGNRS